MAEDAKDESGFKVVDRRPFAPDGSRRDDPHDEVHQHTPRESAQSSSALPARASAEVRKPTQEKTGAAARPEEIGEEPAEDAFEGDPGFSTLVSYLYTTAMFQLGLMQGPGGERIPPDLVNARRTVDMLEVVQEKTRGNLTPSESKLLDEVLYDLRVTFVDVQEQLASKRK